MAATVIVTLGVIRYAAVYLQRLLRVAVYAPAEGLYQTQSLRKNVVVSEPIVVTMPLSHQKPSLDTVSAAASALTLNHFPFLKVSSKIASGRFWDLR